MAKENLNEEQEESKEPKEGAQEGDQPQETPNKGKKIILVLIPVIIIIIAGIVYGVLHFFKSPEKPAEEKKQLSVESEFSFIEISDIIVSLAATDNKRSFLKISMSLQVKDKKTADMLQTKLPIIKDSFQMFLRELRPTDLSGSAGVIMLKNELIKRVNKIMEPEQVMDVLFKEILLS